MYFVQLDDIYNRREVGIPGLDYSNEDEEGRRRRVCFLIFVFFLFSFFEIFQAPFAKPVPKPFEKAWRSVDPFPGDNTNNSNRMMGKSMILFFIRKILKAKQTFSSIGQRKICVILIYFSIYYTLIITPSLESLR